MELEFYKNHLRNPIWDKKFENLKKKQLGQFFTSNHLANKFLNKLHTLDNKIFKNPNEKIIDPTGCGIGNLLSEALILKLENNISFQQSLENIYGIDIDPDAINICRERLLCQQEHLRYIVEKNIICADCTKVKNWSFNGTDPYKDKQDQHFDQLFTE